MAMPTMNGAELAAALRSARPELPIVLSSGTDFVLAGTPFDDVLPKPYSAKAVGALIALHGDLREASGRPGRGGTETSIC